MTRLSVSLLGGFEARLDETLLSGFKTDKSRALLAYLAVERDHSHRRQALAGLFWPGYLESSARASLRHALANLRQVLLDDRSDPPFLLIEGETIQLNQAADVWVDVGEFEGAIRAERPTTGDSRSMENGRSATACADGTNDLQSSISNPQSAICNLQSSIALYRGSFLEGFSLPDSPEFDTWLSIEREGLRRQAVTVLFQLAEAHERQGDLEAACAYARRQLDLEPWLEEAHQQLMRLLAQRGQRAAALAQYEICRKELADELQVELSAETRRLYEAIRDGNIQGIGEKGTGETAVPYPLSSAPLPPTPGESPFKGLQYFDVSDADLFFGRDALTARLVGHIREMVDAGLVGASGSEKREPVDDKAGSLLAMARDEGTEGCCFLAVVGASGSGKSSVVRAGVVPALQRDQPLADGTQLPEGSPSWQIHVITPTAHPLEALAISLTKENESVTAALTLVDDMGRDRRSLNMYVKKALTFQASNPNHKVRAAGKPHLLLVVDQFEELFTLCRSEAERNAFLDNLLTAARRSGATLVIVVLRADFYGHCAQYPRLRQALCARQEYIGPMEVGELHRAIEEPARRNAWEFEPGLVDLILRDIGVSEDHPPEPGALPLLEHALLETWQRRSGQTLTLKGYAEAGGVHGAIAKTAEGVFERLTPEQQALARRIFLRLTQLGEGTQDTRRRTPRGELAPHPEDMPQVEGLLNILAEARLVMLSEDTAEVAHEALIREWPALRRWLREDREGLRLHRHLTDSAEAWAELERDPSELYRGARLAQAQEWADGHPDDPNQLEREFLHASQEQANREMFEQKAQQQRELEAARKLARTQRQRSLVLSVGLLIAIALGVLSFIFYRMSNQNLETARAANTQVAAVAATAKADANIAIGRQALAQALVLPQDSEMNFIRGGLLVVESLARAPGAEASYAAQQLANWSLHPVSSMTHEYLVNAVAFSPDGRWVVSGSADGTARVWDAATGDVIARITHGSSVTAVAFSSDGSLVVSGSTDGMLRVWNPATRKEVASLRHAGAVTAVAFSPRGTLVVSGSADGTARVWEAENGTEIARKEHASAVTAVAFRSGGTLVVSGSYDGTVMVWEAATGIEKTRMQHEKTVTSVAFSPNGFHVVSGSADGTARVFQVYYGIEVASILHAGSVTDVAFSPDGQWVVSGSLDGTVRVWAVKGGLEAARMAHTSGIYAVAFSSDGQWVASSSADGSVHVMDVKSGVHRSWVAHEALVGAVAFSPSVNWIVTGSYDHLVKVWQVSVGIEIARKVHRGTVSSVAFSPDGQWVASDSGTARVWKAATGQEVAEFTPGHQSMAGVVAFSPDGRWVAAGSFAGIAFEGYGVGALEVWDLTTQKFVVSMPHGGDVTGVAFSPDGNRLVTGCLDGIARVWETATGQELAHKEHGLSVNAVAFSPDGHWVVSGSADGTAIVWDPVTGDEVTLVGHTAGVNAAAFSPDGRWVVTGSRDGTARVWEAATGLEMTRMTHAGGVNAVAFSPDGRGVVTGSADDTARVWEAATGFEMTRMMHAGGVNAVAFSPDGRGVVTGSADGTARVWAAATGLEITRMTHGGGVNDVAFSPDGRWVVSGGDDRIARVWVWQPQDIIALLCTRLPRNFTHEEWRLFFGDVEYHQTCANLPVGK